MQGEEVQQRIETIDKSLLESIRPKMFWGKTGVEVRHEKNFDHSCAILEQHGLAVNAKELTVFEFLNRLNILKKQLPKDAKSN